MIVFVLIHCKQEMEPFWYLFVFVCICCAWEPEETYLYLLAIELPGCAQPFFIITLSVTRFSAGRWGVREVDFLPRLEKKMSKDVRYRDSWS